VIALRMVFFTGVYRLSDALALVESVGAGEAGTSGKGMQEERKRVKQVVGKESEGSRGFVHRAGVEKKAVEMASHGKMFYYQIASGVVFLVVVDKSYPKKLAFAYLDEIMAEFMTSHGAEVEGADRPYQFIRFDTFVERTRELYLNTGTHRNLEKLSEDLADIQQVVTRNLESVLGLGEKLEAASSAARNMSVEARGFSARSKKLARQALIRQYTPWAVLAVVVLLLPWKLLG